MLQVELPGGQPALIKLRQDADATVLDRGRRTLPDGPVQLGVSAVGRHLRGTLGDDTVLHGHEPALPDGRVGLLLDGHGQVTSHSITVTPIQH